MLSYELALKLKEAGFPQPDGSYKNGTDDWAYRSATLSELIEACGKDFNEFKRSIGVYYARGKDYTIKTEEYESPEEAIANLWLKLNKK